MSRLVMAVKFCVFSGAIHSFCFQQHTFRHDSYYFFNALFSAVTTDFHRLVLVKSWNGFLYRNIT